MDGRDGTPAGRGFPWFLVGFTAVAFAILLVLGTWQVQRLAWKESLIASIEGRVASAPLSLADVERQFAQSGDVDYQPVVAEGRFRHDAEQFFFATYRGNSGWFVYTPLDLADGRAVFVNRGFVPYDRKDAGTRAEGQVAGEVSVTGLARNPLAEKPSFIVPENEPARNIYYWKDIAAMADAAGIARDRLVPFFIDAGDAANPGGLPVGGVTLIDLPNNHLQYAITWYGLAAALAGVFAFWMIRWRKARHPAARP